MRPNQSAIWKRRAIAALSVCAQIAALVFWSRWGSTQHLLRRHGLAWIALASAACLAAAVIHECGQAILAWCFEMKLRSFKAGPFQWTRREGNWSFRFHAVGLVIPGGSISATPSGSGNAAWEFILMTAAGPGANLLFGAAAAWAVLHNRWATYQQTWELIAYTGAFCLIGAVLNLIPFLSEEGAYSDGARILQIVAGSPLQAAPPASVAEASPSPAPVAGPTLAPCTVAVTCPPPHPSALMPLSVAPALDPVPAEVLPTPVSGPAPANRARPTLIPGTIRPLDSVPLAATAVAKKATPASERIPPVVEARLAIPAPVAETEPEPEAVDPIGSRIRGALARPAPPLARQATEPPLVGGVPAPPAPAAALNPAPAAALAPTARPTIAAPSLASVAATTPPPSDSARSAASVQPATTGVIASVTRISASALSSTPRPSAARSLPAPLPTAASAGPPASGPKAPAVPPAFARRPRPAPLSSGLADIEDILAAAAAEEIAPDDSIAVGETAAPVTSQPATVSQSAALAPTFSETWPPRPEPVRPEPAQCESYAAAPSASPPAPLSVISGAGRTPPTPDALTSSRAMDEAPQPQREPRYDPFEFLRAAAIEKLTADPVSR